MTLISLVSWDMAYVFSILNIAEFFDYLGEREPKRVIYSPSSKREFINALVVEPK